MLGALAAIRMAPGTPTAAQPAVTPPSGVERTLRALVTAVDPAADSLLLVAAVSNEPELRVGAVRALARRATTAGHAALVDRWQSLAADARATLLAEAERPSLVASLEGFLTGDNPKRSEQALMFVRHGLVISAIPALVRRAIKNGPDAATAGAIAVELARTLQQRQLTPPGQRGENHVDPAFARGAAIAALTEAVQGGLASRPLLDAWLEIVSGSDETLLQVLRDRSHAAHAGVIDRLGNASGQGLVALMHSLLGDATTPRWVLEAIAARADADCLDLLLAPFAERVGLRVTQNLAKLKTFGWLAEERLGELLAWTERTLTGAVRGAAASGVSRRLLTQLIEYVLAAGGLDVGPGVGEQARLAAAEAIDRIPPHLAARAMDFALQDPAPPVAAAAGRLVKKKQLPGAAKTRVEMRDHPDDSVRQAAQGSLKGINYGSLRDAAPSLTDDQLRRAGAIVGKADPLALERLPAELRAGAAPRRIAAVEMTETLGVVDEVSENLIKLTRDKDAGVRAEAARVLGVSLGGGQVVRRLAELLTDPAIAVRDAAERSLMKLDQLEHVVLRNTRAMA